MNLAPQPHRRRGLSLLEVIIALAIFLIALIGIGRLVNFGADRALDVEWKTRAGELAQSKMDEVVAGIYPLSGGGQSDQPFDEDPDWHWSMSASQSSLSTNLWQVTVQVSYQAPSGTRIETSLDRLVFDPTQRGTAANTLFAPAPGGGSSGSRGGSSAGGSTTSGGGGTAPTSSGSRGSTAPAAGGRSGGGAPATGGRSGGGAPATGGRSGGGAPATTGGGRSGSTGAATGKP
jgi:type II secretion system protein I